MVRFDRPRSESELDRILRFVYQLAVRREYDAAVELCDWLIGHSSTEFAGLRERAAVRSHMGDSAGAIIDLQNLVAAGSGEAADFHAPGILQLGGGATEEAIEQFESALNAGAEAGSDYYAASSRLFLAEAKLRNGDLAGAAEHAALLPAEYGTWITGRGMRKREDILADAHAGLERDA